MINFKWLTLHFVVLAILGHSIRVSANSDEEWDTSDDKPDRMGQFSADVIDEYVKALAAVAAPMPDRSTGAIPKRRMPVAAAAERDDGPAISEQGGQHSHANSTNMRGSFSEEDTKPRIVGYTYKKEFMYAEAGIDHPNMVYAQEPYHEAIEGDNNNELRTFPANDAPAIGITLNTNEDFVVNPEDDITEQTYPVPKRTSSSSASLNRPLLKWSYLPNVSGPVKMIPLLTRKKANTIVEEVESIPEEVESIPEDVESIPQEVESIPEEVESIPEDVESIPQEIESRPEEGAASLIQDGHIPIYENIDFYTSRRARISDRLRELRAKDVPIYANVQLLSSETPTHCDGPQQVHIPLVPVREGGKRAEFYVNRAKMDSDAVGSVASVYVKGAPHVRKIDRSKADYVSDDFTSIFTDTVNDVSDRVRDGYEDLEANISEKAGKLKSKVLKLGQTIGDTVGLTGDLKEYVILRMRHSAGNALSKLYKKVVPE